MIGKNYGSNPILRTRVVRGKESKLDFWYLGQLFSYPDYLGLSFLDTVQ